MDQMAWATDEAALTRRACARRQAASRRVMTLISPQFVGSADWIITRPLSNRTQPIKMNGKTLASTAGQSRIMQVERHSYPVSDEIEGVRNMAQIREVEASARQRVKQRTKGFQERQPFRQAVAGLTTDKAIELAPEAGESLRTL